MVQQAWKRQKRKQKEKIMNKQVYAQVSEKMNYPLVQNYLKTENSKSEPHSDFINIQESNRLNFEWSSMVAGIADNFFQKEPMCFFAAKLGFYTKSSNPYQETKFEPNRIYPTQSPRAWVQCILNRFERNFV